MGIGTPDCSGAGVASGALAIASGGVDSSSSFATAPTKLLSAGSSAANDITGRVTSVVDGDTLKILSDRIEITIRLDQIDAPEKGQPFGDRAKRSLAELAFGKDARAVVHGQDRYHRAVATVFIAGIDVNAEQVRRGMAWVYRKYACDPALGEIEAEARAARRGLWSDPVPIPPWDWRGRARTGEPRNR
jgi:micrococcal nuclease